MYKYGTKTTCIPGQNNSGRCVYSWPVDLNVPRHISLFVCLFVCLRPKSTAYVFSRNIQKAFQQCLSLFDVELRHYLNVVHLYLIGSHAKVAGVVNSVDYDSASYMSRTGPDWVSLRDGQFT